MNQNLRSRPKKKPSKNGNLILIRESASTARVLNLPAIRDRWGDDEEYQQKPLFLNKRLNVAFILKHTPREHEKDQFNFDTNSVTKIILPFDMNNLELGGQSVFFEQHDARAVICQTLGLPLDDESILRDFKVLDEIARLPSLDPYLLSEKLRREGLDVAKRYFDISEADAERMRKHVNDEIRNLVELAFQDKSGAVSQLAAKFTDIFLKDESSPELAPLRQTMRMSEDEYIKGMYAWKGFLYYKWRIEGLNESLRPVAREICSVQLKQATADDLSYLRACGERIVQKLASAAEKVRDALARYDEAFDALVSRGEPGAFRTFLLAAPELFMDTGERLASVTHITSFWRFRFAQERKASLDAWEAYDLFQDFEASLSGLIHEQDTMAA